MYSRLTRLLLHWLRVPPEPHPPHGDPASLRVFRAGANFLYLRLVKWGFAQALALVGIIFWFGVFSDLEIKVEERRARREAAAAAAATPAPAPEDNRDIGRVIDAKAKEFAAEMEQRAHDGNGRKRKWRLIDNFFTWQHGTATFISHLPRPAMKVIWFFEIAGLIVYLLQLPVTFLLARMDYDLRWYMVTDRSLRIRHGILKINESTMSFANIQQVVVSQNPFQRLLGLSDVKVQSAGGSGGDKDEYDGKEDDMHLGLFHSVTNPAEIRDLILERLRRFRESGLGDPEEKHLAAAAFAEPGSPPPDAAERLAAARELVAEARALRSTLG